MVVVAKLLKTLPLFFFVINHVFSTCMTMLDEVYCVPKDISQKEAATILNDKLEPLFLEEPCIKNSKVHKLNQNELVQMFGRTRSTRFITLTNKYLLEESDHICFAAIPSSFLSFKDLQLYNADIGVVFLIFFVIILILLAFGWTFRKRLMILFNINFERDHSKHILVEQNPKPSITNNPQEIKDHTLKLEEEVSDMPNMGIDNVNFELNLDNIGNRTLNTAKEEDASSNVNDSFPSHSPKNNNFHIEFSRVEDASKILNTDQCFDPEKDD